MDFIHIVVLLLSFGACTLAGPLNLVKTDTTNTPSALTPSNFPSKGAEVPLPLETVQTTKLPTVTPAPFPAIAVTIPAKVTPIKSQTSVLPSRISSNVNQASAVHTPQTLPSNIETGVSLKSVINPAVTQKKNNNLDLHVGTQPAHTSTAQSSQSNLKPNINVQPALHTPVTLPAQVVPQNVKPALHTPVTLPGQVSTNNKGTLNAPQNIKPALHTPVTLPAQVSTNNKGTLNAPQNVKPALHTPVTLPAQVSTNNEGGLNAPQNVKPALHTPVTLPAQVSTNNKGTLNAPQNVKPAIHTPVTLPAQGTPAIQTPVSYAQVVSNKKENVNVPQNIKSAIHTPVTLPAQATPNKDPLNTVSTSKPAIYNPAVGITAPVNNKDQVNTALVKPAIHNPVTLLPHLNPDDKKTKTPSSAIASFAAPASVSAPMDHAPSRFSDSSRPQITSGVGTIRNKRQYAQIMPLPARIPAGFQSNGYNNGGYHGVRPLPAAVRPVSGPIRGSPVYYQQPFAGRF